MSAYIGNLKVDGEAEAIFKIYVKDNALKQVYPVNLILYFETLSGKKLMIKKVIGLRVINEGEFEVLSIKNFITSSKVIPFQKQITQSVP